MLKFIVTVSFIFACVSCRPSRKTLSLSTYKLAPAQLIHDFDLMKDLLEKNHPSIYWYTSRDSMELYYQQVRTRLNDSLYEPQFKSLIAWYIAKIRCGHTVVQSSRKYQSYLKESKPAIFPLMVKTWNDSLVVLGSALKYDSIFKRGIVLLSINGNSAAQIIDSAKKFINADGYAENFKSQIMSFTFPDAYITAFGPAEHYDIVYIDSSGTIQKTQINNFKFRADTSSFSREKMERKVTHPKPSRADRISRQRSIRFDSVTQTAFIRLSSFSGTGNNSFYKNAFKEIETRQVKNLVIDLRTNGGGNLSYSNELTQYLINKPYHFADTVAAVRRNFYLGKYIHPSWFYAVVMWFSTHKGTDNRYHFTLLEKHVYKPKKKYHFDGNIYIIQGGFTFSAAVSCIAHLRNQNNVTIIGEESGGALYGNSAIHLPKIKLPYSKLQIHLPVYRVVVKSTLEKNGSGIVPDINIIPTSTSIKDGKDLKMIKVLEILQNREK